MATASVSLSRLDDAIREVCYSIQQSDGRKLSWKAMSEEDLWSELVACILGSRVRFDVALAAMERMGIDSLLSPLALVSTRDQYECDVMTALMGNRESKNGSNPEHRYPFPRIRARQIAAARETLYRDGGTIWQTLAQNYSASEMRRLLSRTVAGLGPKQASLFLRNIGYTGDVAVLDVHVLSYMNWIGLNPTALKTVGTILRYEMLERKFLEHCRVAGFPPDHFDLAVWIVMRVAKKEFASCQS